MQEGLLVQLSSASDDDDVVTNQDPSNSTTTQTRTTTTTTTTNSSSIWVLGTVHIGSESARDVQALLQHVPPKSVVLEMAPSRWQRLKRQHHHHQKDQSSITTPFQPPPPPPLSLARAIALFPGLVDRGWQVASAKGWFVAARLVWPSLLRTAWMTMEMGKENYKKNNGNDKTNKVSTLQRQDEFVAAAEWVLVQQQKQQLTNLHPYDETNQTISGTTPAAAAAATLIPADWELDDLLGSICQEFESLWELVFLTTRLGLAQLVGLEPRDPLARRRGETLVQWSQRRRRLETARASRQYQQSTLPQLARVLVDQRDESFVRAVVSAIKASGNKDNINNSNNNICVIVGLVHLDGVVRGLQEELDKA